MRPDVALCAVVGLACENDIDLIDFTITIPIIVGIVDLRVGKFQSIDNHLWSTVVQLTVRRRTIVRAGFSKRERADDIKVDGEQSIALLDEIVAYGANMIIG